MEGVGLAACFGDWLDPLERNQLRSLLSGGEMEKYLERVGDHHVTVHEHARDVLVHAREDWRSHGDVGHKVTIGCQPAGRGTR